MDKFSMHLEVLSELQAVIDDNNQIAAIAPRILKAYLITAKNFEECRQKWALDREQTKLLEKEKVHLTKEKEELREQVESLKQQLASARKLVDSLNLKLSSEKDSKELVENQLRSIIGALQDSRNKLNDETREKLSIIHDIVDIEVTTDRLNTIEELESTGSLMSDLSYTRDEDEILDLKPEKEVRKRKSKRRKSSQPTIPTSPKRRRSASKTFRLENGEKLFATTTVEVPMKGPIKASSTIETIPKNPLGLRNALAPSAPPLTDTEDEMVFARPPETPKASAMRSITSRSHNFMQKAMIKGEECNSCQKRMKFSTMGLKCKNCKLVCHTLCKENVSQLCFPVPDTPNTKGGQMGTIADYTPSTSPMIPSLLVHCIKEIEDRGLTEVGLYRVPGSEKEVKALKEKFLKGRGVPNLSQIRDINTVCGCVKDFLRSLKDPLVTRRRWKDFSNAISYSDSVESQARLYQLISELPQPNRETLAFLILHLHKVAETPECKMPISNLAKMFGPGVVGLPSDDYSSQITDVNKANQIMEALLSLPSDYWSNFMKESNSLLSKIESEGRIGFFSPNFKDVLARKNLKFFESP